MIEICQEFGWILPEFAGREGLVGFGGDLSPSRLLSAYRAGIFPWFDDDDEIAWWSPDPRAIFEMGGVRISRSMSKTLRSGKFAVTRNRDFAAVIRGCSMRAEGTWVTPGIIAAYELLHERGMAHSLEVWQDGELAGGIYGVAIGGFFSGESMFHRRTDASKVALICLMDHLVERGFRLFDTQMVTAHTARMGAIEIPRVTYLARLREALTVNAKFD